MSTPTPLVVPTEPCTFCKKVVTDILTVQKGWDSVPWFKEFVELDYHLKYRKIQISASKECSLCWVILKSINGILPLRLPKESKVRNIKLKLNFQVGRNNFQLYTSFLNLQHRLLGKYEFLRHRDLPIPIDDHVLTRNTFIDPREAVSKLGAGWIQNCRENHPRCAQPEAVPLPARLLDVNSHAEFIYLRDCRGHSGQYVTLSYCWGKSGNLTTTSASLDQHQSGIPFQDLPATFKHAVEVTRILGIPYLWIDSLCIIQDSAADWAGESSTMQNYYRNSYLTIGALNSPDSQVGFLDSRESEVNISRSDNLMLRAKRTDLNLIFSYSVLETRAWCLQERLLSTRIIQFCKTELLWECQTHAQRESDVKICSGNNNLESAPSASTEMMKRALSDLISEPAGPEGQLNVWYKLVTEYSGRELTVASDILPAISGVASEIEKHFGFTYLHGLWKEDLCRGLLWHKQPKERDQVTGAPSWSWASTTSRGCFRDTAFSPYHSTIKTLLEVRDTELCGSRLFVRSRCRSVLISRDMHPDYSSEHSSTSHSRFDLEYFVLDEASGTHLGTMDTDQFTFSPLPKTVYKTIELVDYIFDVNRLGEEVSRKGKFLILAPDEKSEGSWRRIGIGEWRSGKTQQQKYMFDDCDYEELWLV